MSGSSPLEGIIVAGSADVLKAAIDATGYACTGLETVPYKKKGLFGL